MKTEPKFNVGDKVRVVKYGHAIWVHKDSNMFLNCPVITKNPRMVDIIPDVVGKTGVVCQSKITQDIPSYAIDGIIGKTAWYDEEQLELIES